MHHVSRLPLFLQTHPGKRRGLLRVVASYVLPLVVALAGCGGESGSPTNPTTDTPPVAGFTFTASPGDPLTIVFTDASTAGTGANISWSWGFGDGTTSTEQNPSHTYSSGGDYTVNLAVTTSVGSNSTTRQVSARAPKADVNSYVAGLSSWPATLAPIEDAPTGGLVLTSTDNVEGREYMCTSTPYSLTTTPEEIVVYQPDGEVLWLGALLQGRGYRDGLGSLAELPIRERAEMKIWIDVLGEGTTRTVSSPSPTTVNQAIGELVTAAQNSGQATGGSIFFSQTETRSVEQSALKIGLSARYLSANVKASLQFSQNAEQNTLTAYFVQKMFTTNMELPQLPGDVFSDELTQARLQEQITAGTIGPDNQPTFISSIVWGRLMQLTITSTASVSEIRAALSASYDAVAAGGSGSVDAAKLSLLQNSEINLVAIGGPASAALGYLRAGTLNEFFAVDAPLTTAVPLSYTVRNLTPGSPIAQVSETTEYNIKQCNFVPPTPTGETWAITINSLTFVNTACDGLFNDDVEAYWSIYPNGATTAPPGFVKANDGSSLASLVNGSIQANSFAQESEANLLFSGSGAITVQGSVTDWDNDSADDLLGLWDLSFNYFQANAAGEGSFAASGGAYDGSCRVNLNYTLTKKGPYFGS